MPDNGKNREYFFAAVPLLCVLGSLGSGPGLGRASPGAGRASSTTPHVSGAISRIVWADRYGRLESIVRPHCIHSPG
jgi:hypothetical protein